MFEQGEDTGDTPGEYQFWVEREHLDRIIPLPAGYHHVRMNKDGVLGMLTGVATAKAAASVMAVGLDPRFDLTKSYWVVAGIGGGGPADVSLGSAVWANHVLDGNIAYEIDAREIPADWPTGYVPLLKSKPYEQPAEAVHGEMYTLNQDLVGWAFQLTRDVPLADSEEMRIARARFADFPNARKPPFVLIGDNLASATYWQGTRASEWARRWVKLYTKGRGTFTTSSCEDSGFMQAITFLGKAARADPGRVLILRAASDYCVPRPGVSSAESLQYGTDKAYIAENEAFDSAYRVGSVVVREWVRGWAVYREHLPGAAP